MNAQILVAAHKPYPMPTDSLYLPLHVGAKDKEDIGFQRDNQGENISAKNPYYSELTGLYWAWKNLDADYIGLAHYRRHFASLEKGSQSNKKRVSSADAKFEKTKNVEGILTKEQLFSLLLSEDLDQKHTIIVPQKRRYYIESLYSHYAHTFDGSHLDIARGIIGHAYPAYQEATLAVYQRTWGYMWNMMIMSKENVDAYCSWVFPILEELERILSLSTDLEALDPFQKRLFGRVSEILWNVWLWEYERKSPKATIIEIPVFSTEPVPWGKKIGGFLQAKLFHKGYKESF